MCVCAESHERVLCIGGGTSLYKLPWLIPSLAEVSMMPRYQTLLVFLIVNLVIPLDSLVGLIPLKVH